MSTISFRVTKTERAMRDILNGYDTIHSRNDLSPAIARKLVADGLISVRLDGKRSHAVLTDKGHKWLEQHGMANIVETVVEATRAANVGESDYDT